MRERDLTDFTFRTLRTADLTAADRDLMQGLFATNYRQANSAYLEKSFGTLGFAAIAAFDDVPAGFALGEMRILDLPRLPRQTVALAGICCINPAFRRRGLFGALELAAMRGADIIPEGRYLSAGRMAHPASMRTMARNATVVPKPGVPITPWQREVGRAIAAAYRTQQFDDETFVCVGSGTPIGYPVMDIEVEPEEWRVFEPVNRDRGDSLLGLCWHPDAPDGW
ncbi:MAG: hypothetical protein HY873_05070 [Chloroflexi bacterium]|nr:hypothetical protein [Chloroflexota bacterium]